MSHFKYRPIFMKTRIFDWSIALYRLWRDSIRRKSIGLKIRLKIPDCLAQTVNGFIISLGPYRQPLLSGSMHVCRTFCPLSDNPAIAIVWPMTLGLRVSPFSLSFSVTFTSPCSKLKRVRTSSQYNSNVALNLIERQSDQFSVLVSGLWRETLGLYPIHQCIH